MVGEVETLLTPVSQGSLQVELEELVAVAPVGELAVLLLSALRRLLARGGPLETGSGVPSGELFLV